jgi:hypothetical protein
MAHQVEAREWDVCVSIANVDPVDTMIQQHLYSMTPLGTGQTCHGIEVPLRAVGCW